MLGMAVALGAGCAAPAACPDAGAILAAHQARYPAWEPVDGYKLLHQATMGSEHAVDDRSSADAWMRREWSMLGEGPAEPLIDTLGREGRFARVHLRAWQDAGGSPGVLVDAFVRTANTAVPDTTRLSCALEVMVALAAQGRGWDPDSVRRLVDAERSAGYPAAHHSERFGADVRPAYRIVDLTLVPALLATLPATRP